MQRTLSLCGLPLTVGIARGAVQTEVLPDPAGITVFSAYNHCVREVLAVKCRHLPTILAEKQPNRVLMHSRLFLTYGRQLASLSRRGEWAF